MDLQDVANLTIPEGGVKTIHDKDNRLLWGAVGYDTKYAGDIAQQTYSGANLYNVEDTQQTSAEVSVDSDGWITMQYDNSAGSSAKYLLYYSKPLQLEADTDYAVVAEIKSIKSSTDNLAVYDSAAQTQFNNSQIYYFSGSGAVSPGTYVSIGHTKADMSSATIGLRTFLKISAGVNQTVTFRISVLANTSVTPETFVYQPFTGNIPAPNPDYPQPINVVTSTQVVSITDGTNTQNFTVDLGSTELCKIGTYQDYIYKSGDDWYVHKALGKIILDGTETYVRSFREKTNTYAVCITNGTADTVWTGASYVNQLVSDNFTGYSFNYLYNTSNDIEGITLDTANAFPKPPFVISLLKSRLSEVSFDGVKAWLAAHNTTIYYRVATPTDTKIIDTALVGQLEAVHEWLTRYGYNATVTGNLPLIVDRTNL